MKDYIHSKLVNIPIWKGKLKIIFSNSSELLSKELDFNEYPYGHTLAVEGGWIFVVLNFHHKKLKMTHAVIAHEAVHAANFILSDRGCISTWDNDEQLAYTVQWVVEQIEKFRKEKGFEI